MPGNTRALPCRLDFSSPGQTEMGPILHSQLALEGPYRKTHEGDPVSSARCTCGEWDVNASSPTPAYPHLGSVLRAPHALEGSLWLLCRNERWGREWPLGSQGGALTVVQGRGDLTRAWARVGDVSLRCALHTFRWLCRSGDKISGVATDG